MASHYYDSSSLPVSSVWTVMTPQSFICFYYHLKSGLKPKRKRELRISDSHIGRFSLGLSSEGTQVYSFWDR